MTPSGPFSLQLGPNITAYPFVHQTFSIPLFLYDGNRELVQGYEIPVIAELFYQQSDTALASADDICVRYQGVLSCLMVLMLNVLVFLSVSYIGL